MNRPYAFSIAQVGGRFHRYVAYLRLPAFMPFQPIYFIVSANWKSYVGGLPAAAPR